MKKALYLLFLCIIPVSRASAQACSFTQQIATVDSMLCRGDSTLLDFTIGSALSDTVVTSPPVNNNGQDGNMFDITATNTIRIRYFEGNIANTPNLTTEYYIYYKAGSHVGFEGNAAAWTLAAGPITFNPNTPSTYTVIPYMLNLVIPAGQTYAFYLTNTSAASNNNRYHNGTATGTVLVANPDLTVYEGTGGAYPFGTFFNARPWEGTVHYDFPPVSYLWSSGDTTSSVYVDPSMTTIYSCTATLASLNCTVTDSIEVYVSPTAVNLGSDTAFCAGGSILLDAGNTGSVYTWCDGSTGQTVLANVSGVQCVIVTDTMGCSASDSVLITVNPLPSVDLGADIIQANPPAVLDAGAGFSSYSWTNSASTQTISVSTNGTYGVTVADSNGCEAFDLISVIFTTGIVNADGSAATVKLYPNPATDHLVLRITGLTGSELAISLADIRGKTLRTTAVTNPGGEFKHTVSVSDLDAGIYILNMITGGKSTAVRFVKQ